ncbi:MAG: DUF1223 domain-containing protein [Bdellovibrionales bacterium]|nr:DUF1223 domain-containing protein [Bdellovibrionales bacterium]
MCAVPSLADTAWKSSVEKVHLLELYSTQSCSSCPPAQNWVSTLKKEKNLWKTFIPVVFHVDYWDYLGWKDPFSKPQFTNRQRHYAKELQSKTYTPMFILDGEESRQRSKSPLQSNGEKVGVLQAKSMGDQYEIQFTPYSKTEKSLTLRYAVLGSDIKTDVKAGENSGMQLHHDFLTLELGKESLVRKGTAYSGKVKINFDKNKSPRQALVFWVTPQNSLKPIQAVGGYL